MGLSPCAMRRNTTQQWTAKMKNWIACAAALALLAACGSSKEATAAMAAMQITDGKSGTVHFASKSGSGDKITLNEYTDAVREQTEQMRRQMGKNYDPRMFDNPEVRFAILDNLSSHKVEGVQQAIAAVGATVLYLPPYSPDLNPIEKLFSKLKTLLRKAAKRSIEDLWQEIGQLLDTISANECANYFASSGYVRT